MTSPPEDDRRDEILSLLLAGGPDEGLVERVCELSAELLGVSGAGLCLVVGSRREVLVHGTDAVAAELEDLQVSLGQGPCIEAVRSGAPVVVPELANFRSTAWDAYARHALSLGVRAVFTFPLRADDLQLGALDLYRVTPGPLDPDQSAAASTLTAILTRTLIAEQERIDLDPSISALHWMTVALREPVTRPPQRLTGLGVSVRDAARTLLPGDDPPVGGPPLGDPPVGGAGPATAPDGGRDDSS